MMQEKSRHVFFDNSKFAPAVNVTRRRLGLHKSGEFRIAGDPKGNLRLA